MTTDWRVQEPGTIPVPEEEVVIHISNGLNENGTVKMPTMPADKPSIRAESRANPKLQERYAIGKEHGEAIGYARALRDVLAVFEHIRESGSSCCFGTVKTRVESMLEDTIDIAQSRAAIAEGGAVPMEEVEAELKISIVENEPIETMIEPKW